MRTVLIWALLACPALAEDAPAPDKTMPARPVVSEIVALSSASHASFVGVVAASTETELGFPVIGTIANRAVEIGDLVASGDLIAPLDPEDFDADLRTAEAGVLVAKARFRAAEDAQARARSGVARR